jgi:hypothetical protein
MLELLFAFALMPWILFLALIALCTLSTAQETTFWAVAGFIVYSFIALIAYDAGPIDAITNDPFEAAWVTFSYLACGGIWSLFKWIMYMKSDHIKHQIKLARDESHITDTIQFFESNDFPYQARAAYNKDRIFSWIIAWPLSVIGYVVGDLLTDVFNWVWKHIVGVYNTITINLIGE